MDSLVPWLFEIPVDEWAERKQGARHIAKATCPSVVGQNEARDILQSGEERGPRRRFVWGFVGYVNC